MLSSGRGLNYVFWLPHVLPSIVATFVNANNPNKLRLMTKINT